MSSTIGASQLGEAFTGASYQGYLEIACATLLVYDYIVTFDLEVQYVWTCKRWKSTSIFVINRCIMLDLALSLFLSTAYCPTETCARVISIWLLVPFCGSLMMWAVFSALRVYAISNRCLSLSVATLVTGLIPSAIALTIQGRDYFHRYGDLYFQISTLSKSASDGLTIIIFSCCIISDTLVLITTWWSLHSRRREGGALSIGQVLIRDGTLCFLCLLLTNIAGILTWYYSFYIDIPEAISALTSIFVSRLMLHLREACFNAQNPSFYFTDVNGDELVFRSPPQVPGASAGVASV